MKACREDNFGWTGFDVGEKGAWQIGVEKHGNWWQMVLLMIKRWKWGGCYLVFFFFFAKSDGFFTLFIGYIYIYILLSRLLHYSVSFPFFLWFFSSICFCFFFNILSKSLLWWFIYSLFTIYLFTHINTTNSLSRIFTSISLCLSIFSFLYLKVVLQSSRPFISKI
jgi:hypothetical protein